MSHLSVIIPDYLRQQLELKVEEMGVSNISEVIRILLSTAIENPPSGTNDKIQKKMLQHMVTTYYLLKEHIISLGENGSTLNNMAHEKADKAMKKILEL